MLKFPYQMLIGSLMYLAVAPIPEGYHVLSLGIPKFPKAFESFWMENIKDLKCVDKFGETETVGEFLTAETFTDGTHHNDPQDEDELRNGIDVPVTRNGQMSVGLPAGPVTVPDEEARRDPQVRCRERPRLIPAGTRGRPRKQYHFRQTSAECPSDETKKGQLKVWRKIKLSNGTSKLLPLLKFQ
ncbi:hypothetical protein M513_09811 [Trichuris suis]|uniref:Uncharacterized protein n=1 Tax=Trichuris suis TaxID=68888 RepID=A0A085LWB3_9BILA|nr:hypothetical protein M513_09811 [Trichuris suis]